MNATMNLEDACKYLNISSDTMLNLADSGTIPGAKVGKGWVFRTKDLDAYLDDVIAKQTEARREARMMGIRKHIKTEAANTRDRKPKRRVPPDIRLLLIVGEQSCLVVGAVH